MEYDLEELDHDDPTSMYYIYLCKHEPKLTTRKLERINQLKRKAKKAQERAIKGHKNEL